MATINKDKLKRGIFACLNFDESMLSSLRVDINFAHGQGRKSDRDSLMRMYHFILKYKKQVAKIQKVGEELIVEFADPIAQKNFLEAQPISLSEYYFEEVSTLGIIQYRIAKQSGQIQS